MLKAEFQAKLKNSRVVGVHGMKKRTARQAIHCASARGRIIDRSAAVTGDDVVTRIPWMRGVVDPELRVVENVERFGSEFDISLAENLEVFQYGNIEVCASWIVH